MRLNIKSNVKEIQKGLTRLQKKQMPYALMMALNETGERAKHELDRSIPRVFRKPSRYTRKSLYLQRAGKRKNMRRAIVRFKDGSSAKHYLEVHVYGGKRGLKMSEQRLRGKGILPHGHIYVPGAHAPKLTSGRVVQIMSVLKASTDQYQNITKRSASRNKKPRDYFAVTKKRGGLEPGVYQRTATKGRGFAKNSVGNRTMQKGRMKGKHFSAVRARGVKPVMMFYPSPNYNVRWYFHQIGQRVVRRRFEKNLLKHIDLAMKTAW